MKKERFFISTLLLVMCANFSMAQKWTTYTAGNSGLTNNTVRAVCIDNYGVYWFGTADGLSRFDGETWATFTSEDSLANNSVNDIAMGGCIERALRSYMINSKVSYY